jgi:hypothetical protein
MGNSASQKKYKRERKKSRRDWYQRFGNENQPLVKGTRSTMSLEQMNERRAVGDAALIIDQYLVVEQSKPPHRECSHPPCRTCATLDRLLFVMENYSHCKYVEK